MTSLNPTRFLTVPLVLLPLFFVSPTLAGSLVPGATEATPPADFERHIMGLFGRMGCNAGSCHGSFQGKNGFRLSLFGYDPEKDYQALTRDAMGRRINPVDPDHSLVLLKAAGQIEHGGGRRFSRNSWQYRLLRDWIAAGVPWHRGSGRVEQIAVAPLEVAFPQGGGHCRLTVRARFMDDTEEDITRFCDFRTNDDAVAEVTSEGEVTGLRPGDTTVVVSYRGTILPVRVLVPVQADPGFRYPAVPETGYIDHEVFAKLRRLNVVPSDRAGDAEFLRRVTIDTIGCLPSPDEVRTFLSDPDPDKRAKKIDALLAHPMHAALWATKFCDITGNNTDALEVPREKRSKMWHDWFRKRLAENLPYDEIVRGVLCATSRDGQAPEEWVKKVKAVDEAAQKGFDAPYAERASLDLFWEGQGKAAPIEQWGERTAAAFLGVRLECAQCHKHPFDRWTQADYRSYANLFGRVKYAASPAARTLIEAENRVRKEMKGAKGKEALPPLREVFVGGPPTALPDPDTNRPLPGRALGGPEITVRDSQDARVALWEWMRSPDNPFFARSFANRIWGHYFGTGLVDPVDDFAVANPPSHPQLLDALARDFVEHHYDIRSLERTILNSRVYQLTAVPNAGNRQDHKNYSHSRVRPLMAEVVVDVVNSALGVNEDFKSPELPPGIRAIEVAPSRVRNANLGYVFRIFGRPARTSACDCQRAQAPALPQALYLMDDPNLLAKLQGPNGRLKKLLNSGKGDEEILEELFLATLTRYPTETDQKTFEECRAQSKDRQAAFVTTLWALVNLREFILNH